MANVLPPENQKQIWRQERARFVFAGSLALLAGAVIAFVALLPGYLVLRFSQSGTAVSSEVSAGSNDDRLAVQQARDLVSVFQPLVAATTTPTQALALALSLKPAGIEIDHITYTAGDPGQLLLSGSASGPDPINAYSSALQADPHFSSVSVPVGALVGANNGRFTITLSGNF